MGDLGISAIASLAIAAIGTGFTVASSISANKRQQQASAASLQNTDRQLRVAESTGTLQAQQQSNDRTRRYNEVISSQTAMWATRGVQLSSGSVFNVMQQSTAAYEHDIDTIEMNRINRLTSLALQGADFQQAAANANAMAQARMVSNVGSSLLNLGQVGVNVGTRAFGSSGQTPAGSGGVASSYPGGAIPTYGGSTGVPTGTVIPF